MCVHTELNGEFDRQCSRYGPVYGHAAAPVQGRLITIPAFGLRSWMLAGSVRRSGRKIERRGGRNLMMRAQEFGEC
jgi:hypothetical protein